MEKLAYKYISNKNILKISASIISVESFVHFRCISHPFPLYQGRKFLVNWKCSEALCFTLHCFCNLFPQAWNQSKILFQKGCLDYLYLYSFTFFYGSWKAFDFVLTFLNHMGATISFPTPAVILKPLVPFKEFGNPFQDKKFHSFWYGSVQRDPNCCEQI